MTRIIVASGGFCQRLRERRYNGTMQVADRKTRAKGHTIEDTPQLFKHDVAEQVLLSVHLLGKPTAAQLLRLHRDHVSGQQALWKVLSRLTGSQQLLASITPLEIERPSVFMPKVYLDTTKSRRHLQRTKAIPFRRPPELPSRDWRFLRHDVEMVDELVTFELTNRTRGMRFGYESHYDIEGERVYPAVTITDGDLTHSLKPQPDKTMINGDYHQIHEKDLGEETIGLGHIMRDATVTRKHLVYDQLERSGVLDELGWGKRIYTYTIDGKKRTQTSSRKRIKSALEHMPDLPIREKTFYVDRQSFMEAGDDVSTLEWIRGDGKVMRLPCYR